MTNNPELDNNIILRNKIVSVVGIRYITVYVSISYERSQLSHQDDLTLFAITFMFQVVVTT